MLLHQGDSLITIEVGLGAHSRVSSSLFPGLLELLEVLFQEFGQQAVFLSMSGAELFSFVELAVVYVLCNGFIKSLFPNQQ